MMENPGASVVTTRDGARPSPKEASSAGESEHLRYLYQCYKRCEQRKNMDSVSIASSDKKTRKFDTYG